MTGKKGLIGLLVLVMVFAMMNIACFPTASSGGTLTITDIPARFNGKYVAFEGYGRNIYLIGAQTFNAEDFTGMAARISNGRVSIPVWTEEEGDRFNGNQTVALDVYILDSASLEEGEEIAGAEFVSVVFSNGSATVSFHDNDDFWE